MDCLFCKIVDGSIPSVRIYEDDEFLVFKDVNPVAPVHLLVIPKKHIDSLAYIKEEHASMMGRMMLVIAHVARDQGIVENGYRVLSNHGQDAGQIIQHLHFHILGGKKLAPIG